MGDTEADAALATVPVLLGLADLIAVDRIVAARFDAAPHVAAAVAFGFAHYRRRDLDAPLLRVAADAIAAPLALASLAPAAAAGVPPMPTVGPQKAPLPADATTASLLKELTTAAAREAMRQLVVGVASRMGDHRKPGRIDGEPRDRARAAVVAAVHAAVQRAAFAIAVDTETAFFGAAGRADAAAGNATEAAAAAKATRGFGGGGGEWSEANPAKGLLRWVQDLSRGTSVKKGIANRGLHLPPDVWAKAHRAPRLGPPIGPGGTRRPWREIMAERRRQQAAVTAGTAAPPSKPPRTHYAMKGRPRPDPLLIQSRSSAVFPPAQRQQSPAGALVSGANGAKPGDDGVADVSMDDFAEYADDFADDSDDALAFPLPDGKWEKAENGFYWSDEARMFYLPSCGHFYLEGGDGDAARPWFVPDEGKWLTEDEHNALLAASEEEF